MSIADYSRKTCSCASYPTPDGALGGTASLSIADFSRKTCSCPSYPTPDGALGGTASLTNVDFSVKTCSCASHPTPDEALGGTAYPRNFLSTCRQYDVETTGAMLSFYYPRWNVTHKISKQNSALFICKFKTICLCII